MSRTSRSWSSRCLSRTLTRKVIWAKLPAMPCFWSCHCHRGTPVSEGELLGDKGQRSWIFGFHHNLVSGGSKVILFQFLFIHLIQTYRFGGTFKFLHRPGNGALRTLLLSTAKTFTHSWCFSRSVVSSYQGDHRDGWSVSWPVHAGCLLII